MRLSIALVLPFVFWLSFSTWSQEEEVHSLAHTWNEQVLDGIRNDFARPTVHARNLLHTSIAMFDCWVAYDATGPAEHFFLGETWDGYFCPFDGVTVPEDPAEVETERSAAISFAVYRIMQHRFGDTPDGDETSANINAQMADLGYDVTYASTDYVNEGGAALGNYVAEQIIAFGLQDGANEANNFEALCYEPMNPNIEVEEFGNPGDIDPNVWQPIELSLFIDQSGNPITTIPSFVGPEWGSVTSFALNDTLSEVLNRDGCDYEVWLNPGEPALLDTNVNLGVENDPYKWGFVMVALWSGHLAPSDGVMIDASPLGVGTDGSFPTATEDFPDFYNWMEGGDYSPGHDINPVTGEAYASNVVPRGDFTRCLAEFWADGPDSETPPGHWFTLLNDIMGYPDFERRWRGQGPLLDPLEFEIKSYLALAGAMHDSAIATWSIKGYHDYIRPVSAIRYMAERGQCSIDTLDNYHVAGLPLIPGRIEIVEEGDALAGAMNEFVGEIKLHCWKGPAYIEIPIIDQAGVGWILAKNWWPYQRPSFVTPPFAGYVSGHSTFSRAAAEILTLLTGSEYFPGGLGTWTFPQNEFLVFEEGPSITLEAQWATYYDAANQSALSRIWGGIHPPVDDGRGREIGIFTGTNAFHCAETYAFPNLATECGGTGFLASGDCAGDFNGDGLVSMTDLLHFLTAYGNDWTGPYDMDNNAVVGSSDLLLFLAEFGEICPN
jgi:hypothetical protein